MAISRFCSANVFEMLAMGLELKYTVDKQQKHVVSGYRGLSCTEVRSALCRTNEKLPLHLYFAFVHERKETEP